MPGSGSSCREGLAARSRFDGDRTQAGRAGNRQLSRSLSWVLMPARLAGAWRLLAAPRALLPKPLRAALRRRILSRPAVDGVEGEIDMFDSHLVYLDYI